MGWREAADGADGLARVRVHIDHTVPRTTFAMKVNVDADR
jgi:hypothetical protein